MCCQNGLSFRTALMNDLGHIDAAMASLRWVAGTWGWLWFSRGIARCGNGLIAIGFFANVGEIVICVVGLGTGLSFYGV